MSSLHYHCKNCNKPVERAIEGELICQNCYNQSEMSPADIELNKQIEHAINHCPDCDCKYTTAADKEHGRCKKCQLEIEEDAINMQTEMLIEQSWSDLDNHPF